MNKFTAAALMALLVSSGAAAQDREEVSAAPEGNVVSPNAPTMFVPSGSVLYDNGPLVNSPGTGLGGADESVLQSVSLGLNILGFGHQVASGNRVADDFVVPASGWIVDRIDFFAYQTGSPTTSTMTAVNFRIWDGPPGMPGSDVVFGDTTTNRLTATGWINALRVTETTTGTTNNRPLMGNTAGGLALSLNAGTYWLDWQTDGSLASGPWAPPITITGTAITGNGLQSLDGGVTYAAALDSGTNMDPQGFPFVISGTVPSADVSVTKSAAAPAPLLVGSSITYTLNASNAGPGQADAVAVTDSLPDNVTYVSNTCGAAFAAPTVTWNIGTLAAAGSATCDIVVTVNNFGPIDNTANITTSTTDPNPANNAGTASLGGVPFPADVGVALSSDAPAGAIAVGTQFNYTVDANNAGPGVANDLLFTLTLSGKTSFVSSSCGAVAAGNTVTWTVASLGVGATTSCSITVAVVAPGDLLASVTVTTSTDDPNLANNTADLVVGFVATQVPTLGHLALLLLALIIAGASVVVIRR